MSAIFGLLELDGGPVDPGQLARMEAALISEGASDGFTWTHGMLGIGQRLGSHAEQAREPCLARGGSLVLVADGRVHNRSELSRELASTEADPQHDRLLLDAYARWGEAGLQRLAGEFSFAVWDERERRLVVACSAPLARPLCYHVSSSTLAFATQPRGLFATQLLRRQLDEAHLAGYLGRVRGEPTHTFFQGVRKLLPGHVLIAQPGSVRTERCWSPDLERRVKLPADADYVEAFTDLFDRVIADHLRGAGQLGLLLSGGLDSGSIAVAAARPLERERRTLSAFTAVPSPAFAGRVPEDRFADEGDLARSVAGRHPNIRFEPVHSSQGLLDGVDRLFEAAEVPFPNAANRGWMEEIYARAGASGVSVLLDGDGGNLTTSWDGSGVLPELLQAGHLLRAIRQSQALGSTPGGGGTWRRLVGSGLIPLLPPAVGDAAQELTRRKRAGAGQSRSLLNPAFAAQHASRDRSRRKRTWIDGDGRVTRLEAIMRTGTLGAQLLAGYQAMYGVGFSKPLLDRRLVEFSLAVPESQYCRGPERRWLIRRAMAGRLPPAVLAESRRGLQGADWFEQMSAGRSHLMEVAAGFARDDFVAHVLHVPQLRSLLEHWPAHAPTDPHTTMLYRWRVPAALMTGRFIQWAQGRRD